MSLLKDNKQSGYKKIRNYLLMENIFIVLAFLLIIVGVYNVLTVGFEQWYPYTYIFAGAIFLVVGVAIALTLIRAFQREDIPAYMNIMESEDIDPELGLYYYDTFIKKADTQMQLTLTNCFLVCYHIDGIEHLRHFVGYQKAADTMNEIGEIFRVYERLKGNRNVVSGSKSGHEIMLFVQEEDKERMKNELASILNQINEIMLRLPTAENFTTYCGYSCYPQHAVTMDDMVKNTSFAVYEATMFRKSDPNYFLPDAYRRQETEYMKDNKLRTLLDRNELQYKFQPIVSAKTGKIYAYEALMRTKTEIGLSPVDVLELATRQDRLYEVEHYTFYNVLRIMSENRAIFDDRKLFLNSIPTAIIKEEEFDELLNQYDELMKHLVIEITENGMQSEESCAAVHKYMEKSGCELALDDYGTGYSNASSLLQNSPNYLKIDHSMIMGIDSDSKKQHLVSGYVSFANNHNMMILAEGVETPEELQMVIQLGCHLIQGFYTGRPNTVIAESINEDIENEIVAINLKLAKLAYENKVYMASNHDEISAVNLALDFYSQILVGRSEIRISGDKEREVYMGIKVQDNVEATITLSDVNMRGREMPVIDIGENATLRLCLEGENTLSYEGIYVPKSSKLVICGDGNLTIHVDHNNGLGIGCMNDRPYGVICFDGLGTLRVESNGDLAVGIGGTVADEESELRFNSGNIEVISNGSKSIGIGSVEGHTRIVLDDCSVAISSSGADAVGIGSFNGNVDIVSTADIEMDASGSVATGIGSLRDRDGRIQINSGKVRMILHCMEGVGVGSMDGTMEISISSAEVFVYIEGTEVGGIGNYHGCGKTYIHSGVVKVVLLAANSISLGDTKGYLEISGGNILCDLSGAVQPVNQFGVPLFEKVIASDKDYFCRIETVEGMYQYFGEVSELIDGIHIYIPKFCIEMPLEMTYDM